MFAATQVEYPGHILSRLGVVANFELTNKMAYTQKTAKQVKWFIGVKIITATLLALSPRRTPRRLSLTLSPVPNS